MKRRGFAVFLAAVMLFAQTAPAAAMEEGVLLTEETMGEAGQELLLDTVEEESLLSDLVEEEGLVSDAVEEELPVEPVEDAFAVEDAGAVEDAFAEEDAFAVEDAAAAEDAFTIEDVEAVEEDTDTVEDTFALENAEAVEEDTDAVEDAFVMEDADAAEDSESALLSEEETEEPADWLLSEEEEVDAEDAELLNAAEDGEENYYVWIEDDGEVNRFWDDGFVVYSDEEEYCLRLNTEELSGLGEPYSVSWTVGHANENGFYTILTEEDGFEIREEGAVIALDGNSLQQHRKEDSDGLDLYAEVLVGEEVIATCGAWLRVWDPVEEYHFPTGDWTALPGWGREIDRDFDCYVDSAAHPYGENVWVEVTSASLELLDGTEEGAITLEERDDQSGWHIQANEFGHARITLYYTTWDENEAEEPYSFEVWVSGEVYDVYMDSIGGERSALPGGSIELYADASHEYYDENGDHQCNADGLGYEWGFEDSESENYAEIVVHEDDPSKATLNFYELPQGEDSINEEVRVYVKILDADGNETEGCYATTFRVESEYLELWPTTLDRYLGVGAKIEDQEFWVHRYVYGQAEPEVLGSGDGVQIQYEWTYDENAMEITEQGGDGEQVVIPNGASGSGNVFSLRRIMDWDTWVDVTAYWNDENGDYREVRGSYHFFEVDSGIWFDEHDVDIYTDDAEPEQLCLNLENFGEDWQERLDAELTVGCWDDGTDYWANILSEGSDYTAVAEDDGSGIVVALTQEYLASLTEDEDVRVTAEIYAKGIDQTEEHLVNDTDAWFHVRMPRYDYEREWDRTMLPGWDGTVNGSYDVYVENAEYPDGWNTQYRVTNVEKIADDPWDEEDGSVITDFHIDYENGDETSENYWWYYRVEHPGEATLRVTYETVTGEEDFYDFTLFVGGDVYSVYMDSTGGERNALPGGSIELYADASHEYFDENGDYQCNADGLDYEWGFEYGEEYAVIEVYEDDPSKAVLRFNKLPEGWDSIGEEVRVYVKILDAEGNETEGYDATTFWVESEYLELWPMTLDPALEVGASIEGRKFEVRRYVHGQDGYEVLDADDRYDVRYEWHYDENAMEVTELPEGAAEPILIADGESGSGNVFTITRKREWHTDYHVRAYWQDENDEDQELWGNYRFNGMDYDIWFEDLRDGDGLSHVYTDETMDLRLNADSLSGREGTEIRWSVGEADDEGNFILELTPGTDGYTVDADGCGITVDGSVLKDHLVPDTDGVNVRAEVYVNNIRVDEDEWVWLRVWDPRTEEGPREEQLFVEDRRTIWHDDGSHICIWDKDHPHGDWLRYTVEEIVGIESEEDDYDSRPVVEITDEGTDDAGDPWWELRAVRDGEARITLRLGLWEEEYGQRTNQVGEKEITVSWWVGSFHANLDITTSTGSDQIVPGGEIILTANLNAQEQDPMTGQIRPADPSRFEICWEDAWTEEWYEDVDESADSFSRGWNWEVLPDGTLKITADANAPEQRIRVCAAVYDHDENDPERRWEICSREYDIELRSETYEIGLEQDTSGAAAYDVWDPDLPAGLSQTILPVVRRVRAGEEPEEVTENVSFRLEWYEEDPAQQNAFADFTITDADGKVLSHYPDGEDGCVGRPPFTIVRHGNWQMNLEITACGTDEESGEEFEYGRMRLHTNNVNYPVALDSSSGRGGEDDTWFYLNEEEIKVTPDPSEELSQLMLEYPGEVDVELSWGIWEYDPDSDQFVLRPWKEYVCDADGEWSETGTDFSFEEGEWSAQTGLNLSGTMPERREEILHILNANERGGFEIRAVVRCGGEVLDERLMHVELKWNEERLEDDDAATIRGRDFYYDGGAASLYVEDTEHCSGNDTDDRPGTYYDVTITNIEITDGDENCLRPERGDDGTWYIRAEQEGSAQITYTYTGGPAGNGTATHTTWLHVIPEYYYLVFEDADGNEHDHVTLLPGESAPVGAVVYRHTFNEEKADAGEENPYDIEKVSDALLTFEYRDYNGYTIELNETDGMITGLHPGDTDVRVGVHVHGKIDGQLREVWYTEETLHTHVTIREGLLDLSEETLYLVPGQEISISELEERLAPHFSIRSLAAPEGAPAQAEWIWFENVDGRTQTFALALSDDPEDCRQFRVLTAAENALEEAAGRGELSPDGTYTALVWTCMHDADGVFAGDDLKVVIHEHVWDAGTVTEQPACTQAGVRTHTCSICGETKTETEPAFGHTLVKTAAKEATCNAAGNREYYTCSRCGKVFEDAAGTKETTAAAMTIAALGHKEDAGTVTTAPTCTKEGTRTFKCTRCGQVLRTGAVAKTAHTPVTDAAVAATCEAAGKSAGSHCSVCGTVLTAQTEIPAKGHVWDAGVVTTEPTAAAEGVRTCTCSVCGKTRTEAIPKLTAAEAEKKAEGNSADPKSVAGAEKAMTAVKDNAEPKGSSFTLIQLQSKKQTKNSITLSWNKVKGASGYIVYGNMCGGKYKLKRLSKQKKTSFVYKKLKKGTYYKFTVVAYKTAGGAQTVIGSSKTVHIATLGGKVTNVRKIQAVVKKKVVSKLSLKAKKTAVISAKQTLANKKLTLKKHRAVKYESSNPKVAAVNAKGKVTAKKKGKCIIYVYSQSGTFAKVTLTVK